MQRDAAFSGTPDACLHRWRFFRLAVRKSLAQFPRMPAAFPKIKPIRYEGPDSKNPLAFKHYKADELVEGRPMKDHLRFSVVYWHTMRGTGADMFGVGTMKRPWEDGTNSLRMALKRVPV